MSDTTSSPTKDGRSLVAIVLALCAVAYVTLTSGFGQFTNLVQRPAFLLLIILLGFALYPARNFGRGGWIVDLILASGGAAACASIIWRSDIIATSLPFAEPLDLALLIILLLASVTLMVRMVGWAFPSFVILALAYALWGSVIPGTFGHRGVDIWFLTETLFLGDIGLWGLLTGVAATTIAPFVLFGSMILNTGGGQTFMDIAMRVSGRSPGGAAKMATVASGLFGMVSGSAVANVATTGNLTIPLMQRLGYPARLSGAVEAVASTGGQLAPPIMGAAAFVMAELVGVSYLTIVKAGIIPSLLFYTSIFVILHLLAKRWQLPLVPEEDMPAWREALDLKRLLPLIAGLTALIVAVFSGRSIAFSAFIGTVVLLGVYLALNIRGKEDLRICSKAILAGAQDAGVGFVTITVLLAGAQILVSIINLTGVGVALSSLIVDGFSSLPLLAPVVVALACLVLGMGVPTTAAYILVASILAPAMIRIGFDPLATHLFVLYFAALSAITPPVCVAVFVASGIAKTSWFAVAKQAMRLSSAIYLLPFAFLFIPGLLGQGSATDIALSIVRATIMTCAIAMLASGRAWDQRGVLTLLLWLAALGLALAPSIYAVGGAAVLSLIIVFLPDGNGGVPETSSLATKEIGK
ncbi:TRAP transporter permease [Pseudophaeobacter profundi]|uniref:TRAP transporter permease n=1 Tax=Pseudophaeobacter profundi TaxID=3034152 RepID=UPI002432CCC2|nr:TRAP transporter fused permease subunit [Pseudophaeobacter profundi]